METAQTRQGGDMDEATARSLRNVIAVLIEQRSIVVAAGASFAARLLDLAILQLRLTANEISEEELSGLSEFIGSSPVGVESTVEPLRLFEKENTSNKDIPFSIRKRDDQK